MYLEIGSEFWEFNSCISSVHKIPDWLNWGQENRLFVTGRTALDHIICDIKARHKFEIVYMPSYCCQTMIDPFISNGIKVLFYDVCVNEEEGFCYNIDYDLNCDAVLVMNYFGFLSSDTGVIIEKFKNKKRVTIIEDATQSLFCEKAYNSNSDYVFSSFRKWFATPGGSIASKINSEFIINEPKKNHSSFLNMRIEGMQLKKNYINLQNIEKNSFLKIFNDAEILLENDYKNYTIDDVSFGIIENLNINKIRIERTSNAQRLLNGLTKSSVYKPVFNKVTSNDCPLFVPVIVKESKRDALKNHLIRNNIFCPVHWNKSDLHVLNGKTEFIYDNELSIICDQRYDTEDMEKIILVINN